MASSASTCRTCLLPDVEPHERDAEHRKTPQEIREPALGDDAVPRGVERPMAEQQRLRQRLGRFVHGIGHRARTILGLFGQLLAQPITCRFEAMLDVTQERPVRLVGPVHPGEQQFVGVGHRQLGTERLDLPRVQGRRRPARHQARAPGDVGSDTRVAITVAPNPGPEPDGGGIERKAVARNLAQGAIEPLHVLRERVPDGFLEDRQHRPDFLQRRGPFPPDLLGLPGGGDLAAQRLERCLPFERREVGTIAFGEHLGDALVLVLKRAAHDLGRVRRDDQLDPERQDRAAELRGLDASSDEAWERFCDRRGLGP